jgi:hypothetical protein
MPSSDASCRLDTKPVTARYMELNEGPALTCSNSNHKLFRTQQAPAGNSHGLLINSVPTCKLEYKDTPQILVSG